MEVPLAVIDISLLSTERENELVSQWDQAMRQHGFAYIAKHGLDDLYAEFHSHALSFFAGDTADKLRFAALEQTGSFEGYTPPGRMSQSKSDVSMADDKTRPPDAVESCECYGASCRALPNSSWRASGQRLWQALEVLNRRVLELSALALKLPSRHYFEETCCPPAKFFDAEIGCSPDAAPFLSEHFSDCFGLSIDERHALRLTECPDPLLRALRAARYLPVQHDNQLRYGEHTDFGAFAYLWRNQTNGLQCRRAPRRRKTGEEGGNSWVDVDIDPVDPHMLVVNAGDLIQRWTNDLWVSNVHRVLDLNGQEKEGELQQSRADQKVAGDSDTKASRRRVAKRDGYDVSAPPMSVVFFPGPRWGTLIGKLPSPLLQDAESKYEVVTAGQHITEKIKNIQKGR